MEFEAHEQRRLRAPFWRDGSRLAFQARKAAETGSLAVVHFGSGLPPRRAFSGVQREAPFPRPRPVVMPENNLPLHALVREEPHRHREFAPRLLAVARIDELYSRPPPVEYEQDPKEISAIIHRDPRMQTMPSWQPVQVVPEDLDVEMTDAPALLEFNMSGALGDACSAAQGSMELFQPAQVVGLLSTYTLSLLFTVDNPPTPHLQQHTNFRFRHPRLSSTRHLYNLHLCGFHPSSLPPATRPPLGLRPRCLSRQQVVQQRARPRTSQQHLHPPVEVPQAGRNWLKPRSLLRQRPQPPSTSPLPSLLNLPKRLLPRQPPRQLAQRAGDRHSCWSSATGLRLSSGGLLPRSPPRRSNSSLSRQQTTMLTAQRRRSPWPRARRRRLAVPRDLSTSTVPNPRRPGRLPRRLLDDVLR